MSETVDILKRARALIEKPEAWGQGASRSLGVRCMGQAIADASPVRCHARDSAIYWLHFVAGIADTSSWIPLTRWNDAPCRTHSEVVAAFDRAIAQAEAAS